MRKLFRSLWRRHRTLSIAFIAMILLTLVFALRFALTVFYWHNPENRHVELKSWMTLGHVSMVYDISEPELIEALDLPPQASRRLKLRQIARLKGVSIAKLEEDVAEALEEAHEDADDGAETTTDE